VIERLSNLKHLIWSKSIYYISPIGYSGFHLVIHFLDDLDLLACTP
jgi:hypothetical protein